MITAIINIFGAPGAGKSTTATGVFAQLKLDGINAEYVPEVAKDFTWEERAKSLTFQAYVHAKQMRNIERLIGKVQVIVTDSPPLLSFFYGKHYGCKYPDSFYRFVKDCHIDFLQPSLNYYLKRVKAYNPMGRNQTEAESDAIAGAMEGWLDTLPRRVRPSKLDGDHTAIARITRWAESYLRGDLSAVATGFNSVSEG